MRCYSIPDALYRLRRTDTAPNRRWLKHELTARGGFVWAGGIGTTWVTGEHVELQPFCGPADLIDTLAANGGEVRQEVLAL